MRNWVTIRTIERTVKPNTPERVAQTVDAIVAKWIPVTAALLACAMTPSRGKLDSRYYEAPNYPVRAVQTVDATVRAWIPATQAELQSYRVAARPPIDVRRYEWAPESFDIVTRVQALVRTWIPVFDAELASQRTNARPPLDGRRYEWSPDESGWIKATQFPAATVAQTAPTWTAQEENYRTANGPKLDLFRAQWSSDVQFGVPDDWQFWVPAYDHGGLTSGRARLDVRRYDWSNGDAGWMKAVPAATVAQTWPAFQQTGLSGRTPSARVDLRAYDSPTSAASWVQATQAQGPTVAQMAPIWTAQSQNVRVTYRRYFFGLVGATDARASGGDSGIVPPTPPTVAQTVPAWAFDGDRTASAKPLDLFRAQSIPDIFGVPDDWITWVPLQSTGGLTRERARLDVRAYDWIQPAWIFTSLPVVITDAQKWPAILEGAGLSYRTPARPLLDVRGFEWSPEFTWVQPVANAAIIPFSSVYGAELASFRTGDRARLDLRSYDWLAWVQGIAAPPASVNQTVPAWAFDGDLTSARARLDVRGYDWSPSFAWANQVVDASIARLAPVYSGELASVRTNERPRLDVRAYKWSPDEGAWILVSVAPPATTGQIWPALLQNLGTQYRTSARAKLDPRAFDWSPEFTWPARVVDATVAKWIAVFDAEVSFRTPNDPALDVRRITDAPELAWLAAAIQFVPPPDATADVVIRVRPDVGIILVKPDRGRIVVKPDVGGIEA